MTKSQLIEGIELYRADHNLSLESLAQRVGIELARLEGYLNGWAVLTDGDALKISLLLRLPFEPELKSCPFCGGEAKIVWSNDPETDAPCYAICCPDCEIALISINTIDHSSGFFSYKWDAIEAWNRRRSNAK